MFLLKQRIDIKQCEVIVLNLHYGCLGISLFTGRVYDGADGGAGPLELPRLVDDVGEGGQYELLAAVTRIDDLTQHTHDRVRWDDLTRLYHREELLAYLRSPLILISDQSVHV